jgi:uncharacterized protein
MAGIEDKIEFLRRRFREIGSAVVAFSGGVDSSVLVVLASQELGQHLMAATAVSPSFPESDRTFVKNFCLEKNIPHTFVKTFEFEDPSFLKNPEDRCYFCKKCLYETMTDLADGLGFSFVVEGTNASDLCGHRPGYRASQRNPRVVTPLIDCGFTKIEVRALAHILGLNTAKKPAAACLASRIPTGMQIEPSILLRIDQAEDFLRGLGISQVRVRHHGDLSRIEVSPLDMEICMKYREMISEKLKALDWNFVALDLQGYKDK